ncbi:hypothetical protein SPRG_16568 [Saprolegnia parasitica CBS 223.65]|uniref:Uncharacterized protein n=1 Tax=Saprolegnia parasitica (strain CBS 223.65) TaxID=695850 RepID=A0A067BIN7_SAPPC|nr:hypothetical protein SPRG_16568 [Saprolegnia parasitica CBS 223.65]KDO18043.1 hypothetical protein SPRG_16568 [Saprolegnia parasitica CBS 223.65]|eukprot:XP_012211247.1 hypothetical protein SPRG_16568 [Saprolegnia parasitica CBS 223.65]
MPVETPCHVHHGPLPSSAPLSVAAPTPTQPEPVPDDCGAAFGGASVAVSFRPVLDDCCVALWSTCGARPTTDDGSRPVLDDCCAALCSACGARPTTDD